MLPLRFRGIWWFASACLLVAVLIATMMPAVMYWPDRGRLLDWFVHVDKWLHGITFVFLAIWFAGQYRPRSYWRIGVGLLLFGVLIEACQRLVTYRSSEWFDIVADSAGILVGLAIAAAGLGGWSLRLESWYLRRTSGAPVD
jgi:hypothetical protein